MGLAAEQGTDVFLLLYMISTNYCWTIALKCLWDFPLGVECWDIEANTASHDAGHRDNLHSAASRFS
ncbi:unnamed protein product [Knipowitschia caucasica]